MSTVRVRDERGAAERAFVAVSETLTGFDAETLYGTGLVGEYRALTAAEAGEERYARFAGGDQGGPGHQGDPDGDPELTRAVVQLWYTGRWPGLAGGRGPYTVSVRAYAEGLVWRAVGVAAPGVSAPGFGSWTEAPAPLDGWTEPPAPPEGASR
ncbi:hypothetical protein [Streptomyces katsurahamanus]|uniref:hypothetical protein n=1 Tax=Streptomyces katsurahamanus TaxID=2577098 RepID=UPI002B1F776A|nr:hypothetical protein [Streptomyces katsurahamanus]